MAKAPVTGSANVILPTQKLAGKVRSSQVTSDLDKGQSVSNPYSRYAASAINSVRTRQDTADILRTLSLEEGLFSSSANSMTALAAGSKYKLAGYDASGKMDTAVTAAGYAALDTLGMLTDYSNGFDGKEDISSLLSTLQLEVILTGGVGVELVLSEDGFYPDRLVPIDYSSITWEADGKGGRTPTQDDGDIDLNLPTVFIAEHNRLASDGYSTSILRPGLSQVFNFAEMLEDTARTTNRAGFARMVATIDQEAVKAMAPPEVRNDPVKMATFFNTVKSSVESALEDLNPEDGLTVYDSVSVALHANTGTLGDVSTLIGTMSNLLGVSLKTPAVISGLDGSGSGGQSLSNSQTLVYLRVVSAVRKPVEQVMSRALTLAVRLMGIEGHIRFAFEDINLRPSGEMEAYYSTKQRRILELLSFGLITDAEACFELGIRPQGLAQMFSGTGFYSKTSNKDGDTTTTGERISSTGRSLNPGTPENEGD